MIRKRKWIEIHSRQELAAAVAARTVDARLRLALHHLRLAASAAADDREHVHQTRVASRRAMTALSVFEHFVPRKEFKWFRKKLRRIRKAAGAAREYDVLAERLAARPEVQDQTGTELLKWVRDQRRLAQQPISAAANHLKKRHFKRRIKRLVKKLIKRSRRRESESFGSLASVQMNRLIVELFAVSPSQLRQLSALHEFRVRGKHLRYTMEILASAFSPEFRERLYGEVAALQEELGRINDHAAAAAHYRQWLCDTDDEQRGDLLRRLIADETSETLRLHEQFLADWTAARAANLKREFLQQLQSADRPSPMEGPSA
jgi:CHAD domain-containing protein